MDRRGRSGSYPASHTLMGALATATTARSQSAHVEVRAEREPTELRQAQAAGADATQLSHLRCHPQAAALPVLQPRHPLKCRTSAPIGDRVACFPFATGAGRGRFRALGNGFVVRPLATLPNSCTQAPSSPSTAISTTSTRRIVAARPTTRSWTRSSRRCSRGRTTSGSTPAQRRAARSGVAPSSTATWRSR